MVAVLMTETLSRESVGDIGAGAVGSDRYASRSSSDGDGGDHRIGRAIDDGNRVGICIGHIHASADGTDRGARLASGGNGGDHRIGRGIDDGNRVAALVGHVDAGAVGTDREESRELPTGMVATTVFVAVLMTETVLLALVRDIDQRLVAPHGRGHGRHANREAVGATALVGVSMTETVPSPRLGTYANGPCCACAASGASIASAPSQTPPTAPRGVHDRNSGRGHGDVTDSCLVRSGVCVFVEFRLVL